MKAAVLMVGIIKSYSFIDGNKRVAIAAAEQFLENNHIIVLPPLHSIKFFKYIAKIEKDYDN